MNSPRKRCVSWAGWGLLVCLVAAGCRPAPSAARASAPRWRVTPLAASRPVSGQVASELERSLRVGRQLFLQGAHASDATGFLFSEKILPGDSRIDGWVALDEPAGTVVDWLGESKGELRWLYRVKFSEGVPELERRDEPALASHRVRYQARKTARAASRMRGAPSNALVLAGDDPQSWSVYLLFSEHADRIGVGGEERIDVSADGLAVLRRVDLSERGAWMALSRAAAPEHSEGPQFFHGATPWPLETHVRVSLLHQTRVLVETSSGVWSVQGGAISFHGPDSDDARLALVPR